MTKENGMSRLGRSVVAALWGCAALFTLALVAAPALALDVKTDNDKTADFSHRKTYAWKTGTEAPNPLTEQKIHMAVDAALRAKGLTPVDANPDLWVVTHASVTSEERINVETFGYGGGWGWNGWYAWGPATTVRIANTETGVLLVDILDGPEAKLIWRGIAHDTLPDIPNPDKVAKKVTSAVTRMFKAFPPPPPKPEEKK
jgi:uncharacterized protein DUF4136